ncbi:MAG TPA: peptidyl-prolyl cis-trans isomerase, partial [Sulfuricurvum sp.]|nr:peptidyl-prolyl cis-trans isomerase [Sulfuricurvum sp.]
VKDEPITLYDIEQKMEEVQLTRKQAVDLLLRETLEAQEIKKRNLKVTSDDVNARISQIANQNGLTITQLYDAVWSTQHLTQQAFKEKLEKSMLTQKLYGDIAMSGMETPGEDELQEYYRLHPEQFSHSDTFEVTVYQSPAKGALQRKMSNPMLQVSEVTMQNAALPYARLEPQLAALLSKTIIGEFTPVLPDPKGGYVAFYIRSKSLPVMQPFSDVKSQVQEALIADKREQTLKDYFERARLNADIKIIRLSDTVAQR